MNAYDKCPIQIILYQFKRDMAQWKRSKCPSECRELGPNNSNTTETKMSSFWWNFHHWLHWKLSFWQLSVQPVMKISSKWRHFRFSDRIRGWVYCVTALHASHVSIYVNNYRYILTVNVFVCATVLKSLLCARAQLNNPLRAKFLRSNINMYFQYSHTQTVKILPHVRR